MPETEPLARGILEGAAGTARTHWEKGGIRYTQSLLLGGVELAERGYRVLLVRLTGENSSKDYTEATEAFAVRLGGRWLELEWRQGLVHAVGLEGEPLVAAVEIGEEGIEESAGARLRFRGNMPPGTSGAMTVKIPLERLAGEVAVNGLRDLDFDEEYRRIKRGRATSLHHVVFASGHPVTRQPDGFIRLDAFVNHVSFPRYA